MYVYRAHGVWNATLPGVLTSVAATKLTVCRREKQNHFCAGRPKLTGVRAGRPRCAALTRSWPHAALHPPSPSNAVLRTPGYGCPTNCYPSGSSGSGESSTKNLPNDVSNTPRSASSPDPSRRSRTRRCLFNLCLRRAECEQ